MHHIVLDGMGALYQCERTHTVQHDVVHARVPEPAVLGQPQHDHHDQSVMHQIQRRGVLRAHPGMCRRLGIGLIAQVDEGEFVDNGGVDELVRLTLDIEQPDISGPEFTSGLLGGRGEYVEIEFADQFDVLCDRDRRIARDVLGEPDTALGRRQRERATGRCGAYFSVRGRWLLHKHTCVLTSGAVVHRWSRPSRSSKLILDRRRADRRRIDNTVRSTAFPGPTWLRGAGAAGPGIRAAQAE